MTTRQELLDRWRNRLFEAEEACDDPLTDSWSARLRRKLYRFLLTMYGQADWPGPKDDVDNEAGRRKNSQLVFAEPQGELVGKEPRTRAQILQGLQNIKGLSDELAPAGPLADGLLPTSPVAVAAFKKLGPANRAWWLLRRAGLGPTIRRRSKLYQIFVASADSAAARVILDNAASEMAALTAASEPLTDAQRAAAAAMQSPKRVPGVFPKDDNLTLMSGILYGAAGLFLTINVAAYYWSSKPLIGPDWTADLTRIMAVIALFLNLISICSLWTWWRWR